MERIKISQRGATLAEVMIAAVLFAVVAVAGSTLFINFKRNYVDYTGSSTAAQDIIVGSFYDVTSKIALANSISIPQNAAAGLVNGVTAGQQIALTIDEATTPGTSTDDTTYTYYRSNTDNKIYQTTKVGNANASSPVPVADNVTALTFAFTPAASKNTVQVNVTTNNTASFQTVVTSRCRSAL
jgi:hypothetical protein